MRAALLLIPLFLLAACQDEPDFESRYSAATEEIEARAKAMDADIGKADQAAAASEGLPGKPPPPNQPPSSGE